MAISLTVKDVNIHVGDIVRVHLRIKEGDKERIQIFEGLLIAIRGREAENKTFTVRKMSTANIGVERIFPWFLLGLPRLRSKRPARFAGPNCTMFGKIQSPSGCY